MKNTKILAFLTIAIFILSVNGHVTNVAAQNDGELEINMELLLMTNSGNRIRESYAFFVKQAVAPLGIDVEILAKPFGQFVGDLLHLSTGQPFDLAIIGFAGGGPTPSFMWKYHSTRTSFGQLMFQLNNADWQEFMESDIGVSTAEVDALLESIDFELDPLERLDKLNEFAELFMKDLLYDLPLTTVTGRTASWRGFEFPNGDPWDVTGGMINSRKLGVSWNPDTTPETRVNNPAGLDALQFRIAVPSSPGNFDPYQSFDTSTTAQTGQSAMSLISTDGNFAPHPELAQQWFVEDITYDHDDNVSTADVFVEQGKHTFILNQDFVFPETTAFDGSTIPAKSIDGNDLALVLDMFNHPLTSVNGKELYQAPVAKWEVSSTLSTNDTFSVYINPGQATPDDYVTFGGLTPLPSHILADDLSVADLDGNPNGTSFNIQDDTFNPQSSVEWQHFTTLEGNTLVGAYEIASHPGELSIGDFFTFEAREDYPFPNEWDIMQTYSDAQSTLDDLYATVNTTGWEDATLETWAPHTGQVNNEAYFWAHNATDANPMQKPTTQGITDIIFKVIPDTNAALIAFEAGDLDLFGSSSLGANTVEDHSNNPDFVVQETFPLSGPTLLVFNLLNEHLQKRNVRYAMASVLDKTEMIKINDGFATPQHSPVWRVYDQFTPIEFQGTAAGGDDLSWYTPFEIPYDYETGRDLMRLEGYKAADSNEPQDRVGQPPVSNVFSTIQGALGSEVLLGLSLFAFVAISFVKRKSYHI